MHKRIIVLCICSQKTLTETPKETPLEDLRVSGKQHIYQRLLYDGLGSIRGHHRIFLRMLYLFSNTHASDV